MIDKALFVCSIGGVYIKAIIRRQMDKQKAAAFSEYTKE